MLDPTYRYVSLDFETTGLDIDKDQAIQIGLVVFDHNGKKKHSYRSFIKPTNTIAIGSMAGYITGISQVDLDSAPDTEAIYQNIKPFFDEKTILIGHNIGFDIAFLEKTFPGIIYSDSIDTYNYAQNFVHFPPSFALEVLCQHLQEKPLFMTHYQEFFNTTDLDTTFHDALYDAYAGAALFLYIASYITLLYKQYVHIGVIRNKTQLPLLYTLLTCHHGNTQTQTNSHIPIMEKSITIPQLMAKQVDTPNFDNYPRTTQLYIGNKSPKTLATYIAQHKKVICVFSHKTKADIIKHHLHDMGVYGIASLYDEYFFDPKRFALLLAKKSLSQEECNFLCKYLSHIQQKYTILDMQQEYEKKIIYFLQETKPANKAPIVFATHNVLYQQLEKYPDSYKDYTIYFFDQDRWYMSYNDFASHVYDPENLLVTIEKVVYTYDVCVQAKPDLYTHKYQSIQDFYVFVQIFLGILAMDTRKCFDESNGIYLQIDPPLYHHHFYRTQKMWNTLQDRIQTLHQTFPEGVMKDIKVALDHLQHILNTIVTVQKHSYVGGYYFVYKEANRYVQWQEFLEVFATRRVLFFSHYNTQNRPLDSVTKKQESIQRVNPDTVVATIDELMQKHDKIFVLSTQKSLSESLFGLMHETYKAKKILVVAENITGGSGKNIFLAQQTEKVILIGGYSFFLQCIAKRLYIDKRVIFFIKGSMEKLLLCDMQRYADK